MVRTRSTSFIDRRRRTAQLMKFLLVGGLFVTISAGCRRAVVPPAEATNVEIADGGFTVKLDRPAAELEQIVVTDHDGRILRRQPTAPGRRVYHVPFRWSAGQEFHVQLPLDGRTLTEVVRAPYQPAPLRVTIEMPLGQQPLGLGRTGQSGVVLPESGRIAVGITVESRRQVTSGYRLTLTMPEGVMLACDDRRLRIDGSVAEMSGMLEVESDYVQVVALLACEVESAGRLECRFEQWTLGDNNQRDLEFDDQRLTIVLRRAGPMELANLVECADVVFPADPMGKVRPEQLADTVVLPNPVWAAVRRWLRPSGRLFNYYEPYAYQSLELSNRADLPLNLVVQSEVAARAGGEPLLDFAPPVWLAPRESPTADHLIRLEAGETAAVTMPLYVRAAVRPGSYQRHFRVYLVGSQEPLAQLSRPLEVVRGDPVVSVVVIVAVLLSLIGWTVMALVGRRLLGSIGTEGLTLIGMIASLHFVVSYAARIGGDIIAGVTGPFYIFIAGVANEGLTCLLLAVLVTLVPRFGVLTLSSLTVFLLNAMFTGQLGLVDLLFVTVSIILGEAALAAVGVTTGQRLRQPRKTAGVSSVARVALAIGVSNAATLYVQYCLIQVLHRLFFAAWYVASVSIITGLVYGGIGAMLGVMLGYELRRTVR